MAASTTEVRRRGADRLFTKQRPAATQRRSGADAAKARCTRSAGRSATGAGGVVLVRRLLVAPASPGARMSRAVRPRPTDTPSRTSTRQVLRTPYTPRLSAWILATSPARWTSATVRADGGRRFAA